MTPPQPSPVVLHRPCPPSWLDRLGGSVLAMNLLVFAASLVAYFPSLAGALLWDDAGHVTRPDLQSLHGLWRIWFEPGATQQYYPLLHSAFWLEHRLWGDAPLGYHVVNVLLHATSACLFAALLRRLALPGAWLAALLFALHPVGVESVAWISEQKNTLSTALALGAALGYLRFEASRRRVDYAWASVLFVLALLAKTVVATLPGALLVLVWWRRGRRSWRRDVTWLAPWLLTGAALGLVTATLERTQIGASGADFALGSVERVLIAGRSAWFYAGKILWPAPLIFIYPRWHVDALAAWQWLFPLSAVCLLIALWFLRQRGLLAAALIFGGTLFPVLGFVNLYPFLFSFVADHFQYLACLALLAPLAGGLTLILPRLPVAVRCSALAALLLTLGGLTWHRSHAYRDVTVLYETTLAQNPDCWLAHHNLAEVLAESGRVAEAVPHLEKALALRPNYPEAENNLGYDLTVLGRPAEAIAHHERALALLPAFAEAHNNLGIALLAVDRPAESVAQFEAALQLKPHYPVAHFNLGLAFARQQQTAAAIAEFAAAVGQDPAYAEAELNWGTGLALSGRIADALPHFSRAVELRPASADSQIGYGRALAATGRVAEALSHFERALALDPHNAEAHLNLAFALRQVGRMEDARVHYDLATRPGPVEPAPRK